MSEWVVVPCLLKLRDEFNAIAPKRDKGSDGTIGDSAHTSSSDHTPDEDSDILRDHDADSKNEVHALDIDSSGPWPRGFDFVSEVRGIKAREFARGSKCRLQYVICNGMIANRDIQGGAWREYHGADPHTGHAHVSARYTTAQENDTSDWGIDDMALTSDDKAWIVETTREQAARGVVDTLGRANRAALGKLTGDTETDTGDRQILGMLRNAVGGPINEAALTAAIIAKLNDASEVPSNLTEEGPRTAVEAGVRDVLRSGVDES